MQEVQIRLHLHEESNTPCIVPRPKIVASFLSRLLSGKIQKCNENFKDLTMIIADRLKALRESKKMSQGDIEQRTGLFRCYISRVENGHTVPGIETLEKMARALDVPFYQLFYDGEKPPALKIPEFEEGWGSSGADARTFSNFRRLLGRAKPGDRKLLLHLAAAMVRRKKRRKAE
jgi:transcriptional regulator with XRE-family HTH domain